MGWFKQFGILSFLVLVFCAGFCSAAESSSAVIYIQGSGSVISNGSNGMIITVKDVVPYFHITDGVESKLIPVELVTENSYPLNAVIELFNTVNESKSIIQVSNLSFSDENMVLTLHIKPLDFYDGEMLKSLANGQITLSDKNIGEYNRTGIYLESLFEVPSNSEESEILNEARNLKDETRSREAPSNTVECKPCICCDFGGSGECGLICTCCKKE